MKTKPEEMTMTGIIGEIAFSRLRKKRKKELYDEISRRPIDISNLYDWIKALKVICPTNPLFNRITDIKNFIYDDCRNRILLAIIYQSPKNLPKEIIDAIHSKLELLTVS